MLLFSNIFSIANAGRTEHQNRESKSNEVKDCFEKVNRGVFAFNQGLDKVIFKPLATGYRKLPQPIRSGASNALGNRGSVVTIPNNILQGQIKDAGVNTARFIINTTLGLGGLFDVASFYGLQKREKEDYGQTLGKWGVSEGCYFVLPVLGPTTVRDSLDRQRMLWAAMLGIMLQLQMIHKYFNESDYYLVEYYWC